LALAALTLGFARRFATYKRATLLFRDPKRLARLLNNVDRPVQIIFAGKAHPMDQPGKTFIREIVQLSRDPELWKRLVFIEDYDMEVARHLVQGVDVWLNTPLRPQEASGTSGMKAALNGVPSLSVLDGWWIEGHIEGVTGWSIGDPNSIDNDSRAEALSLYDKLENVILPLFYDMPDRYTQIMRSAIALNGSFFNTQRMVSQYLRNAYARSNGRDNERLA
jgi:starch phosphorylase